MAPKKRPKNKQELSSKSGHRPKKELPRKIVVEFSFTTKEGVVYKQPQGRIKVSQDGGVSCLILTEEGWKPVKAILNFIKMKTVIIKKKDPKKK
jgi:hypothetical protein